MFFRLNRLLFALVVAVLDFFLFLFFDLFAIFFAFVVKASEKLFYAAFAVYERFFIIKDKVDEIGHRAKCVDDDVLAQLDFFADFYFFFFG